MSTFGLLHAHTCTHTHSCINRHTGTYLLTCTKKYPYVAYGYLLGTKDLKKDRKGFHFGVTKESEGIYGRLSRGNTMQAMDIIKNVLEATLNKIFIKEHTLLISIVQF